MDIWRSLGGVVTVKLTSGDLPRRMRELSEAGLRLERVRYENDLTVQFRMSRSGVKPLRQMTAGKGDILFIGGRRGVYWTLRALAGRKLLLAGLTLQLALMLYLPTRILFITVEGNRKVPAQLILEAAEDAGVGFGTARRAVRSEKVKNDLLSQLPELQWAGVNTYGCRAVITVREREEVPNAAAADQLGSIIAARDGYVLSATVTRGNGLCGPGQAVRAGEVLISGYTDCGLTIMATHAEGEILALTSRELEAVMPEKWDQRTEEGESHTRYSLILGKKRINFYKGSGILDATCVRMYTEYVLTLPGGYQLPVKLLRTTWTECETEQAAVEQGAAENALCRFAGRYLRQQMVAGSICTREEAVELDSGVYRLRGRYACREMIGRFQEEKIGESYGETDRTDGER